MRDITPHQQPASSPHPAQLMSLRELVRGPRKSSRRWYIAARGFGRRLRQHRQAVLSGLSVCAALLILYHLFPTTKAASLSLTKQEIMAGTTDFNAVSTANDGTLSLQKGDMGQWHSDDGVAPLPTETYSTDSQAVFGPSHKMYYVSQVGTSCRFMNYEPTLKKWTDLKTPPQDCYNGISLDYDGSNYMYLLAGGSTSSFFRYNIAGNSWTKLTDIPGQVGGGASLVYARWNSRGYIYALRGNSSNIFFRYDIIAGTWSQQAPFVASALDYGQTMTWDQSGNLYVLNNHYGDFKRYSLSSNTWTTLAAQLTPNYRMNRLMTVGSIIYSEEIKWGSTDGDNGDMQSYNTANNTWTDLPNAPAGTPYDMKPTAATDGTDIYALYGPDIHPSFYRYTIGTQSWNIEYSLYSRNAYTNYHWKPIFDGGHTAYFIGGNSYQSEDHLMKYDLQTNQLVQIDTYPPFGTRVGIAGAYYNNALYMIPDFGQKTFAKYDFATNSWIQLADFPLASNYGSDIIDGGNGFLYAVFGGSAAVWKFSEAGGWVQVANMPHTQSSGGSVTRIGATLWDMPGGSTAYIDKYNVTTNTWTSTVNYVPVGDVQYGGAMFGDGAQYLYVAASSRTDTTGKYFYRYDTVGNTWKRLANLPSSTNVGAFGFYDSSTGRAYLAPSAANTRLWYWTPTAATYQTSGDWYSKTYDLTQVSSWTSLTYTVAGTGTAQLSTRSSTDGQNWEAWTPVSGSTIGSNPHRYLQIKANLSGNATSTPTLTNLQVTYAQETAAPSVPPQFTATASATDHTALVSGQTYEYEHPTFSWSGSDDGANGSGVDGYYVYFGTDSNADPAVSGTYQTSSTYTASKAMTAGSIFYVRLAVKDKLGNVSPTATYFSYRYFYISPPGTVLNTTQSDFAAGTNTSVELNANPGSMQLKQQAGGSWSTGPQMNLPDTSSGGATAVVGDYLYVARGSATTTFWRYDTVSQTWNTMTPAPSTISTGSAMSYDGSRYLYVIRGGTNLDFMRYDITNDAWTTLTALPDPARSGTDLTYIGGGKFIILFTNTPDFYVYDSSSNTFTSRTSPGIYPDASATGDGIYFDGADTVYVYSGGGYYSWTNRKSLMAYSVSQDSWKNLSAPSASAFYMENNLVSDGHGHLYIFGTDSWDDIPNDQMASRYTIATDTWDTLPNYYAVGVRGTVTSDNQRYIYIIPSQNNSRKIIRYDTVLDKMSSPGAQPKSWQQVQWNDVNAQNWAAGQATTATYDGSTYVYALGGSNGGATSKFLRYKPSNNTYDYLPPPPYVGLGGSMVMLGNVIYYLPASGTVNFYRYDPGVGEWTRMADAPATVTSPGPSTLISDGTSLYALRGATTSTFYKYTPDGGAGTWTTLVAAPGTVLHGGAVYDGSRYIYLARSTGTGNLYRYDTTGTHTWATMSTMPTTMSYGVALAINNGKIFATAGNTRTSMYVYDIGTDTWATGTDSPEPFRYGASIVKIDNTHAIAFAGQDNPDIWNFNFPATNSAYQSLATHVSQPIPVAGIYDYAGIQAETTIPANTAVEFYTRTSADGTTWDPWILTTNSKISPSQSSYLSTSRPQHFIQVKVVMSSFDNLYTPVVGSYALDYYNDIVPPTNPTHVDVYSDATKTAPTLDLNTWYNYNRPDYDWPDPGQTGGATDGQLGSHLKGYWVYVGTDPTAVPSTAGVFVTATDYQPTLTSPGTYYFRLQAQDVTGNISPAIYDGFTYKFDAVPPDNPAFITVTPSGFTSRNNYSFVWPNGHDADSGVASYCYHTGATSGPFATEICQSGNTLDNVSAAYTQGTNVLYLRTLDTAGNYSSSESQVSFYYSTAAPTPPTNLRAIPPVSAQNMFAFVWDLPTLFSGDPDQVTYCYSINELPSELNTTCGKDRFLAPFKAATQQNTNIIYMVAKDEANNVNWNNYATANFIANTVSPGIPLNLVIIDSSDRLTNRWALTLTWDKPTFEGNGIDHYIVERSIDQHTYTQVGTTSNTAFIDMDVVADQIYYYRIRASDNVDNYSGPSGIASQAPKGRFIDPPAIVSEPIATPSFDQATIDWVTARDSTGFVYYGTSPTDLSQSKGTLDVVSKHKVTVTGLSPSTVYFYRVQSFDLERNYTLDNSYSPIYTFRTSESAQVDSVIVSDIGLSTALVSWHTNVPTSAKVDYGTDTDYSFSKTDDSGYATNHILKLDGMQGGTLYHLRISATTAYGSVVTSDDYHFDTIPLPTISNVRFQPINDQPTIAVRVTWTTNVPTDTQITYDSQGSSKKQADGTLSTDHSIVLADLASNADYRINLSGRDQYGNLAGSDTQTWHSQVDTRPPTISKIAVNVANTGLWGNAKAQVIISWHTDEPASSQVVYGDGLGSKLDKSTPIDTEPTTDHVVVINGLDLTHVYGIQPVSRDISGNTAHGATLAAVTPDKQNSLLDIILSAFQAITGSK